MRFDECSVAGCEKVVANRGWCRMHYTRWRRHGEPGEAAPRQIPRARRPPTCGVPSCGKPWFCQDLCQMHYARKVRYGDPIAKPTDGFLTTEGRWMEDRFFAKVRGGGIDECWEWQGHLSGGYGSFRVGTNYPPAHRWAYEFIRGEIPDGLQLDHLCRNRACVNPWHVEPVTARVNSQRMWEARRTA